MTFAHAGDSHTHSLGILNLLYQYDDFMASIVSMVDLGCGNGDDLKWWATRTTRDDVPIPLNIRCTGVDLGPQLSATTQYNNIFYQQNNFEDLIPPPPAGFDILWCHDSFQYALAPIQTLSRWWDIASPGAMLYIGIPVTQRIHRRELDYHLTSGCYYHHTLVSLIYMLATAGWDCRAGFFKQAPNDPWIHAVVYKSVYKPLDPKTATWHTLSELKLLPESADRSIMLHNYLRQQDLVVPWLDHSLMSMAVK
jgi:SAM-dependent methyltransferase